MFRSSLICLAVGTFLVGCGELEYESNTSSASFRIDLEDTVIGSGVYDFRWVKGKVRAVPISNANLATRETSWTTYSSTQSINDLQDGEQYDFKFIDSFDWKLVWKKNTETLFNDFDALYGCDAEPANTDTLYAKASACVHTAAASENLLVRPVVFEVKIGDDGGNVGVSVGIEFDVIEDQ